MLVCGFLLQQHLPNHPQLPHLLLWPWHPGHAVPGAELQRCPPLSIGSAAGPRAGRFLGTELGGHHLLGITSGMADVENSKTLNLPLSSLLHVKYPGALIIILRMEKVTRRAQPIGHHALLGIMPCHTACLSHFGVVQPFRTPAQPQICTWLLALRGCEQHCVHCQLPSAGSSGTAWDAGTVVLGGQPGDHPQPLLSLLKLCPCYPARGLEAELPSAFPWQRAQEIKKNQKH